MNGETWVGIVIGVLVMVFSSVFLYKYVFVGKDWMSFSLALIISVLVLSSYLYRSEIVEGRNMNLKCLFNLHDHTNQKEFLNFDEDNCIFVTCFCNRCKKEIRYSENKDGVPAWQIAIKTNKVIK